MALSKLDSRIVLITSAVLVSYGDLGTTSMSHQPGNTLNNNSACLLFDDTVEQ
jgi:hypothetical protein